jgi:nitrile hydratase
VTSRFRIGDRVRTRAVNPEGHTRLPRYLCDRAGTIEAVHGTYPRPDERALGVALEQCTKETLYTVFFEGGEVWRERAVEPVSISADLWDSYLEPERVK